MATTLFRRDHLLRKVVDPTGTATDYLGRATTSTVDAMGRSLVAIVFPASAAVALGSYFQNAAGTIVYKVTVAGTTAGTEPTPPGYGATVVSGTATVRQETTA